jgi:hypothetical protein
MENKEITISPVPPDEAGNNQKRAEIRFDCLVKMYDVGYVTPKEGGFLEFTPSKPYAPQWFKSVSYLTLEKIKYEDPYVIGVQIKQQFEGLERAIKEYEDSHDR